MIATKLHILAELCEGDPLVAAMQQAPCYSISREIVGIMDRRDVQDSVIAMVEAGIARLPYAPLLVEFSVEECVRRFVLLDEVGDRIQACCAALYRERLADVSESRAVVSLHELNGISITRYRDAEEGGAIILAVTVALLMLNTAGIDKQVIDPAALNAQRVKRGRAAIPSHTVIRIGTIFDRSGRAVTGSTGRHMPVHLRAGHVRHQACGPDRADRKLIYVPPVLVNYREGDQPRQVKRLVRL
ncbi:hypothetical protein MAUB1S_09685 [Mycolicibacterium aubagnense]